MPTLYILEKMVLVLETKKKKDNRKSEKSLKFSSNLHSVSLRRTEKLDLCRRCKSIIDSDLIGVDDSLDARDSDRGVDIKLSGESGEWSCSGSSFSSMLILLLLPELLLAKVAKEFLLKLASLLGGVVS